jgi:hypothetical protein
VVKTALLPKDTNRRNLLLSALAFIVFWNVATLYFDSQRMAFPLGVFVLLIAIRPIWLLWERQYVMTGFLFLFGLLIVVATDIHPATTDNVKFFVTFVLGLPGFVVPVLSVCRFFEF